MSANQTLGYEVFVSDPIGLNVDGPLPNGEPRMFAPLSSTLILGARDAVLTDPPLTIDQGKAVGDWIETTGKTLTHIFATHGHAVVQQRAVALFDDDRGCGQRGEFGERVVERPVQE